MRTVLAVATLISAVTLIFLTAMMLPRCKPGDRGAYLGGVLIVGCPR